MLALLICLQVVKCFLDRVCHLNFSSCYPSVWGGFFEGNIMSYRLTIISRSGLVFEMGDCCRYCWRTLPYKNRGRSTGHDINYFGYLMTS